MCFISTLARCNYHQVTNIDRNKPQSLKFKASSVLAGQRVKRTEPPRTKTHISQNNFPDYSNNLIEYSTFKGIFGALNGKLNIVVLLVVFLKFHRPPARFENNHFTRTRRLFLAGLII